jgi:predicted  nucleic acid-binding Zn-ribbon protein
MFQLDAFATPALKKDLDKLKADCERVNDERTAVLSEIDDLRTRYIGMERRLEAEAENHCRALDQLRDERESRYVALSSLGILEITRSKLAALARQESNKSNNESNNAIERKRRGRSAVESAGRRGEQTPSGYYSRAVTSVIVP